MARTVKAPEERREEIVETADRLFRQHGYANCSVEMIIREIGVKLTKTLRKYDYAGRYGGEEFAIIAPEAGPDAAGRMAAGRGINRVMVGQV